MYISLLGTRTGGIMDNYWQFISQVSDFEVDE